jgi:PHD/YefM family antitoxin component YafN of YafNO toxin-antitoxin module
VPGVLAMPGTQLVGAGVYMAKIDARFEGLMESDALLTKRSDERYAAVVERIASLERDRSDSAGRLIRLEEQCG